MRSLSFQPNGCPSLHVNMQIRRICDKLWPRSDKLRMSMEPSSDLTFLYEETEELTDLLPFGPAQSTYIPTVKVRLRSGKSVLLIPVQSQVKERLVRPLPVVITAKTTRKLFVSVLGKPHQKCNNFED